MTLDALIVLAGIVLSSSLIAVLITFWPSARLQPPLCLKMRPDPECTPSCLRTCHVSGAMAALTAGHGSHSS